MSPIRYIKISIIQNKVNVTEYIINGKRDGIRHHMTLKSILTQVIKQHKSLKHKKA